MPRGHLRRTPRRRRSPPAAETATKSVVAPRRSPRPWCPTHDPNGRRADFLQFDRQFQDRMAQPPREQPWCRSGTPTAGDGRASTRITIVRHAAVSQRAETVTQREGPYRPVAFAESRRRHRAPSIRKRPCTIRPTARPFPPSCSRRRSRAGAPRRVCTGAASRQRCCAGRRHMMTRG